MKGLLSPNNSLSSCTQMAAAKISKEHGPQDPNGTADPGQTDPRTRPKTPDPTTAPEVLIMLPAAFRITDVLTGKRRDYFSWLTSES